MEQKAPPASPKDLPQNSAESSQTESSQEDLQSTSFKSVKDKLKSMNLMVLALGVAGAISMIAGLVLVISANIKYIPDYVKLASYVILLASIHLGALKLSERFPLSSYILHFLGSASVIGGLALFCQTFNIDWPGVNCLLIWAVLIAPVGLVLTHRWIISLAVANLYIWLGYSPFFDIIMEFQHVPPFVYFSAGVISVNLIVVSWLAKGYNDILKPLRFLSIGVLALYLLSCISINDSDSSFSLGLFSLPIFVYIMFIANIVGLVLMISNKQKKLIKQEDYDGTGLGMVEVLGLQTACSMLLFASMFCFIYSAISVFVMLGFAYLFLFYGNKEGNKSYKILGTIGLISGCINYIIHSVGYDEYHFFVAIFFGLAHIIAVLMFFEKTEESLAVKIIRNIVIFIMASIVFVSMVLYVFDNFTIETEDVYGINSFMFILNILLLIIACVMEYIAKSKGYYGKNIVASILLILFMIAPLIAYPSFLFSILWFLGCGYFFLVGQMEDRDFPTKASTVAIIVGVFVNIETLSLPIVIIIGGVVLVLVGLNKKSASFVSSGAWAVGAGVLIQFFSAFRLLQGGLMLMAMGATFLIAAFIIEKFRKSLIKHYID